MVEYQSFQTTRNKINSIKTRQSEMIGITKDIKRRNFTVNLNHNVCRNNSQLLYELTTPVYYSGDIFNLLPYEDLLNTGTAYPLSWSDKILDFYSIIIHFPTLPEHFIPAIFPTCFFTVYEYFEEGQESTNVNCFFNFMWVNVGLDSYDLYLGFEKLFNDEMVIANIKIYFMNSKMVFSTI